MRRWHIPAVAFLSILLLLGAAGCGRRNVPAGWDTHRDPSGFVVSAPRGWQVETAPDGRILVQSEDKRSKVLIQPFFQGHVQMADEVVQQVPDSCAEVFPRARIQEVRRLRMEPSEASATMTYFADGAQCRAALLCSVLGRSGMLFAIGSPEHAFETRRQLLVQILKTFSFAEPSSKQAQRGEKPGLKYVRWEDPREKAFTVEVPQRWNVNGGLFRFHAVDVRPAMEVVSPDGQVRITGGDMELPTFAVPSPTLQMAGFGEGSMYSPGYGAAMQVQRYTPGLRFAEWYVTSKVAKDCTDLAFTERRERADLVQSVNATLARYNALGLGVSMDAGEVLFTCRRDGQDLRGYYLAVTQLVEMQGGGLWHIEHLFGYLAAAAKEPEAEAALKHMVKTFRPNPPWLAIQQGLAAKTSEIVADTHNYISDLIDSTYRSRQASGDEIMRKWSNMMLGQADVRDPETGESWKVAGGHNYYWRKEHTDVGAGTETFTRPDIDFVPLLEW
ncbi:MAG: hypothetical protein V1873_00060 [Verrucomicrobiota bacterium]